MPKCPSCGEEMNRLVDLKAGMSVFICPNAKLSKSPAVEGGRNLYLKCDQIKLKEKEIKLFKQALLSDLSKRPMPKEDYKRVEKGIKDLEQADVNDIMFHLESNDKLKKQIEMVVRQNIKVDTHLKMAYDVFVFTYIMAKLAEKIGLEIPVRKLSEEEMMKTVVTTVLEQ